ncbi:MAG: T9SS type A sorting domain-containing protein [Saprospiraceae bacterium]|nr:T9SS type A sorting domain-containing protein [Saprospiraceae bacterium]
MKAFFILLSLVFAIQAYAQRPEPVSTAGRNQLDPAQLQGPPPDTEPPVVVCADNLNIPIGMTGFSTIWASDILTSVNDNVTPAALIRIGIRKAGAGTGFPVDALGNPELSAIYNCTALGPQLLELWAIDEAGNADYCTAEIQLQDPFFYCNPGNDSVILCVRSGCNNEPMPGISYSPLILPFPPVEVTDSNGCGVIYIPPGISAVIAIEKDDAPANGVNTLDMLRISQHITGVQPIMNPYLLIAADANKSGSITTFDIIEFQKLIKGLYTELPNNTSWRFVDGSFQFPNPLNPFMTAFPEIINISDEEELPDSILVYGVKIGDIDCSATLDSLGPVDYPDANLVIKDTLLQAGQVYEMPIYMGSGGQWGGYQFALSFDPSQLECVGVTTTQWSGPGHWAAYPGRVSTSWIHAPFPVSWQANEPMTILRMKALQPLQLSTVMQLETNGLHAEAYQGQDALIHDLTLQFEPQFKAPELPVADKNNPGPDPTQLVDQAPPVLVCFSGFSVNIMPTGMVNLWSSDFVESVWDNATTPGLIDVAVRKAGTGSGFPEDALGEPIYNVLFTCVDLGSQTVEVWARDLAGNTIVCQTVVEVQDNNSNCENQAWNVAIIAKPEGQLFDGVEEAEYIITGNNPNGPFYANQLGGPFSGSGLFDVAVGSNITASIIKNDNQLNGVTTYDKVLINKHILGLEPLNSPYKIIAADTDNNGVVDSLDILEIDKLILGQYTEFPNNTSWRFVPKDFVFQDPSNPFVTPFPESISIQNLQFPVTLEFVGIKVGDVNNSAVANLSGSSSEERKLANQLALIGNAFPNPTPAGAVIPMELHANTRVNCSVYTMQGRQVWMNESELSEGIHSLDIPAEAFAHPGMYLWRVRAGDTVKTGKIVVK